MPDKKKLKPTLIRRFIKIVDNIYLCNTHHEDEFYMLSFDSKNGKINEESFTVAHHFPEYYNDGTAIEASKKTYGKLGNYQLTPLALSIIKEFKKFYKS